MDEVPLAVLIDRMCAAARRRPWRLQLPEAPKEKEDRDDADERRDAEQVPHR